MIPHGADTSSENVKELIGRQYKLLLNNSREMFENDSKKLFEEAIGTSIMEQ